MPKEAKITNSDRLKEKGLIPAKIELNDTEKKAIAGLSKAEVDTLIAIGAKLKFDRPLVFPDKGGLVKFF